MNKTIIFDLGGVIEKIDPSAVTAAFEKLGIKNPGSFFSLFRQSEVCTQFELGKIDKNIFLKHLKESCSAEIKLDDIELAWCANQLGTSKNTVETLCSLRKTGARLLVLSNTNVIHAKKIAETFYKKHKIRFETLFDSVYYSFDIRLRKPQKEAYSHILINNGLQASDCIFIDDLRKNLLMPKKMGMRCIHHVTNSEINIDTILAQFI